MSVVHTTYIQQYVQHSAQFTHPQYNYALHNILYLSVPPTVLICQYFYSFSIGNTEGFQKILKSSALVVIHLYGQISHFPFTTKILKMGEIYTDSEMCWLEALTYSYIIIA